ncbi:MAG: TetR/AcrR family transcriptional regulator [Actinomycetota bacterium]|nr:TetR/AcrR family transcriptional regulator [Actinomycetota bacterium]
MAQIARSDSSREPSAPPVDGRTARAVRTRDAIVDACIALVDRGDLRPTAPRIAEEAGVSVRSVFQHFDDLETLFAAVGERVVQRLAGLIVPIDPALALEERIGRLVGQRANLLEVVTPIRRAASVHSVGSVEIGRLFQAGHCFLREQVKAVFAPELARAGAAGDVMLDSLDVTLAWSTWETLRALEGRSEAEARRVQEWLVRAALQAGVVT